MNKTIKTILSWLAQLLLSLLAGGAGAVTAMQL